MSHKQRHDSYSPYLHYHHPSETITLTFPPTISFVTRLKNNYGFKMVYYRNENGLLQECTITPSTVIEVTPDTSVFIYMRPHHDILVTYTTLPVSAL